MLLSRLSADPARFQMRDAPYSAQTVDAIVASGIDLAKFDALPVIDIGDGRGIIAGDGHSRFEAIKRLSVLDRLPEQWRAGGGDYDIPCKLVTADKAQELSWTGNFCRDNFSAVEEAKVFDAMRRAGYSIDQIAAKTHRKPCHVRARMSLNCLCADIRALVGHSMDGGGLSIDAAVAMAQKFQQYEIAPQRQQQLWQTVLKSMDLTPESVRAFMDRIGDRLNGVGHGEGDQSFLFDMPESVPMLLEQMRAKSDGLRRLQRAVSALQRCSRDGDMAAEGLMGQLKRFVDDHAERILGILANAESIQSTFAADACCGAMDGQALAAVA